MKVDKTSRFFRQGCFLINIFTLTFCKTDVCVKKDSCTCESSRGIINLHSIANDNKSARFTAIRADLGNNYTLAGYLNKGLQNHDPEFYYNPCNPFSVGTGNNSCQNVALCKFETGDIFSDIGEQSESVFGYNTTRESYYITYGVKDSNISSTVFLQCDHVTKFVPEQGSKYFFTLHSPCACFDGCLKKVKLSAGTIICIVFFSVALSYLVVGVLYKKAVYGSEGTDLIPNVVFWIALASLIKDGYLFFISPCLSENAEYRRYERL